MDIFFSFVLIILTLFTILYLLHKKEDKEDYDDCLEEKSGSEILQCYIKRSKSKNVDLATLRKISVEALLKKIA